jgi:hypothetical protein
MGRALRILAVVLGAVVSVAVAAWLAPFLEQDKCLDWGGVFDAHSGLCLQPRDPEYWSAWTRPGSYAAWALFLGVVWLPGWLVYRVVRRLVGSPTHAA